MYPSLRRSIQFLAGSVVSLAIAACAPTPTTTPSASISPSTSPSHAAVVQPSPSTSATSQSSAEPSITVPGDSVLFPADSYAVVVTDDLRVRSKPGVSADSTRLEPLLQEPMSLLLLDGPVQASGYGWYQVQPIRSDMDVTTYPFGWIAAASKDGEPWIEPRAEGCPSVPETVDDLGSITQTAPMYYEITCFGGDAITFRARIGSSEVGCDLEAPWGVDPMWLDPCKGPTYLEPTEPSANSWRLVPTWSPGIDTSMAGQYGDPPEDWPIVEVTGMFDHPAAQTCRNRLNYEGPDYPEPDPASTILSCRTEFVVTSMTEIGG
jgi:hypothetical protein